MANTYDVVVLGCDHLIDWDGLDGRPDVLSPRRQAELDELASLLATFEPTKVAVEELPSRQAELDDRFGAYLSGRGHEDRREVTQIAFRLAQLSGAAVHAVDADWTLDWAGVEDRLARHPAEHPGHGLSSTAQSTVDEWGQQLDDRSVTEILRLANRPPMLDLNDREYLDRWLPIGSGDNWGGVDLVASWYRRNLRIVANIHHVAVTGDRIAVVIGTGHATSLAHFFETSGRFNLVSVADVLGV